MRNRTGNVADMMTSTAVLIDDIVPIAYEPASLRACEPASLRACEPASREPRAESREPRAEYTPRQAAETTRNRVSWRDLYKGLSFGKALFRGTLLAFFLTSPSWAALEASGTAVRGELIRCPDWQRLMPPVVLAGASEGQTKQAFEARAGLSSAAAKSKTSSESCSHVVVAGDTLGQIASDKLGTATRWREIIAANPGLKPTTLQIGSTLQLPCAVADGAGEAGAGAPPARADLLQRLRNALSKPEPAAVPAPGTPAAEAEAAEAVEETVPLPPPPVWTAAQGEFLADVLTRWGTKAGWTVIVDTTDAWRLQVAFRAEAAFDAAVAELIRGMGHDGVPPRVRLYPNQVLRLGGPL